jgi:hypothetical protein
MPPDQLGLQRLEEGRHRGIVVAVALATHRHLEALPAQDLLVVVGAVLRATIGVVNAVRRRLAQVDRQLQCTDGEVMFHAVAHRPADHPPGMQIENDGEGEPASPGPDTADVAGPFFVGTCRREIIRLLFLNRWRIPSCNERDSLQLVRLPPRRPPPPNKLSRWLGQDFWLGGEAGREAANGHSQ